MSIRPIININGVLNPIKRTKMLSQLKRDKVQVAFRQESHLNDTEHAKLNNVGYTSVFFLHTVQVDVEEWQSCCAVNFEYISEHKDKEGRYIMIIGKIEGILVSLFNVYIPPGSNWSFYKHVLETMTTKSQGILICGGDFNIRLNPRIDSSNGKSDVKKNSKKKKKFHERSGNNRC